MSLALSTGVVRVATRIRKTRLVRVLKRVKRPFALWPIIGGLAKPFRARKIHVNQTAPASPKLRWRAPAWLLVVLLLVGAGTGYFAPTIMGDLQGTRAPSVPDFNLGSTPASMTVPQGQLATFVVSMNSLNSFAGSVNLNVSVTPTMTNATYNLNPTSVSLFTGSATATLTIPVPATAPVKDYFLLLTGVSGKLFHSVTLVLQVTLPPSPDFQLQTGQLSINLTRGSGETSPITLTSISGFSGLVNVSASVSPSSGTSPTVSANPNRVALLSDGTSSVVLTVTTYAWTTTGPYNIVVQGISGSLSNTLTISLNVQ